MNPIQKRSKIGLALGGGAFRGIAHIGVLQVLEENGIKLHRISGTSIGALIGALYAFGTPAQKILEIARGITWMSISHFALSKMGLLNNNEIGDIVENCIGKDLRIEDSHIPLSIVATDISKGKKVVFEKGNLTDAVVASTCIPGIFIPVEHGGRLLVDGFLVENVPVSPLKKRGLDLIIAINLDVRRSYAKPSDIIDVIISALDIAVEVYTHSIIKTADILIEPEVGSLSRFDSKKADKFFERGYRAGKKALPKIETFLKDGKRAGLRKRFIRSVKRLFVK